MGNWSPYSEEWERQRIEKFIEKADAARKEFEKKPRIYKTIVRGIASIKYYGSLFAIHTRMIFDRQYREQVIRETDDMKGMEAIIEIFREKPKE